MKVVMHLRAGGCGGCALEFDLAFLAEAGFHLAAEPAHADILVVSGSAGPEMQRAVGSAWDAMADPKQLVLLGDCAIGGSPFGENYARVSAIGVQRAAALMVPGTPPPPETILAALIACGSAAGTNETIDTRQEPREPATDAPGATHQGHLPAAPRHRLAGDESSGS